MTGLPLTAEMLGAFALVALAIGALLAWRPLTAIYVGYTVCSAAYYGPYITAAWEVAGMLAVFAGWWMALRLAHKLIDRLRAPRTVWGGPTFESLKRGELLSKRAEVEAGDLEPFDDRWPLYRKAGG